MSLFKVLDGALDPPSAKADEDPNSKRTAKTFLMTDVSAEDDKNLTPRLQRAF
jgi:hypothetical protein